MKKTTTTRLLKIFCRLYLRRAKLGRNSFVLPPFRISNPKALFVGDNTRIGQHTLLVVCHTQNNRHYTPRSSIGNNVLISSLVFIADTTHDYKDVTRPMNQEDLTKGFMVKIEENAFIGVNACIQPGVRIGKKCGGWCRNRGDHGYPTLYGGGQKSGRSH